MQEDGSLGLEGLVLAGAPRIHSTPWVLLALLAGRHHRVTGKSQVIFCINFGIIVYLGLPVKKGSCAFGKIPRESGVFPLKMLRCQWAMCIIGMIRLFHSPEISVFDLDHSL